MRVYQGGMKRGDQLINARTGKKVKVPRLARMHAENMEVKLNIILYFIVKNSFNIYLQFQNYIKLIKSLIDTEE